MDSELIIRRLKLDDWSKVWRLITPVFEQGTTYAYDTDLTQQQAKTLWVDQCLETYIAQDSNGEIVGTFYLKANFGGNADHVCNCGYIVAKHARGKGVAAQMCIRSQQLAKQKGFRAMQFNFVVSTNSGAVRLWQKLGFEIIGTLPAAFRHPQQGLVDAHIMFKHL